MGAPTVHVELHRRESLPLEVTNINLHVASTKDAVHIACDIRLTGKARTNVGGNVETDVLPLTTRLIARPDACITLRSCPPVDRNDERASLMSVVRHYLGYVGNTIQTKRIARTHPCDIGFQYAHARVAYLLYNIALQQGGDAVDGVKVRLRPQAYLNSFGVGIVTERLQVLNIPVEGCSLTIACSVAVIGQNPSEWHIVGSIPIDDSTSRELISRRCVCCNIIATFRTVQRLTNTTIDRLLALHVATSILEEHATLLIVCWCPIVAVVGIQVPLIESKLRQQYRMTCQLIVAVEQVDGLVSGEEEYIEVVGIVMNQGFLT